jgi:hypothetical protein
MPTTHKEPTQMSTPATARQLTYLRHLAEQTGTTFTAPTSKAEASRAIQVMKTRARTPREERRRERRELQRDMATHRGDAARVTPAELRGWGSTATWAQRATGPHTSDAPAGPRVPSAPPPVELGRYRTSAGTRVLYGQRVDGIPRVIDAPQGRPGRRYLIERGKDLDLDGRRALQALVADYIDQSERRDGPAILLPPAGNDAV